MSLDYFALDVGISHDPRIQRLISQQGGLSLSVYILLLTRIYSSSSGYSLQITDDDIVSIAITLRCKTVFVHEVIAASRRIGLFSEEQDPMLLTSPAIYRRYQQLSSMTIPEPSDEDNPDAPAPFPPSVSDIARYLKQRNWDMIVDAEEFHRYYNEINWSIHGNVITDWRAKAEKWAARRLNTSSKTKRKPKSSPTEPKPPEEPAVSAQEFLKQHGLNSITDILRK